MNTENRIVNEFIKLVKIDSVSYHEKEVCEEIKRMIREMGLHPEEDQAGDAIGGSCGNIFFTFEGEADREPVLLSSHMDTVEPGIGKNPIVDEEKRIIHSDGTTVLGADNLAGVMEILEGIRRVQESGKTHRTAEVLFTICEEVYAKGAEAFDYGKLKSTDAYCLDTSGDIGVAVYKAPTLLSFKAIVHGKASHAGSRAKEGINAILTMAEAITNIPQGQVDQDSTLNVGKISGGTATNIVSDYCECAGEIRSFNHERALELVAEAESALKEAAEKYGATYEFEHEVHIIAYEKDHAEPVVQRFVKACEQAAIEPKLETTLGGSDNNKFNAKGMNGIVVACGMEKIHTTNEFIKIDNLVNGAKLVEELLLVED